MSPSASWAKSVMPTRTEDAASPGVRTHSCSLVYLRSSGYTALLRVVRLLDGARRLSGRGRLGVGRRAGLSHADDLDPVALLHVDLAADVLDLGDEAAGEVHRGGERVRVADRVDDVGRLQHRPVDEDATTGRVGERGLRDHADLVVELDHLGAGVPELLEPVQQLVRPEGAPAAGHGDPDPRPDRR